MVKVLSLHCDLPANFDTIKELEALWLTLDLVFDSLNQFSLVDVNRILDTGRLTTCLRPML